MSIQVAIPNAERSNERSIDRTQQQRNNEQAPEGFHCVDVKFVERWKKPVPLETLKRYREVQLQGIALFRQTRLSVMPVTKQEYEFIHYIR